MVCEFVEPRVTFPKLTAEGVRLSAGCTPLPLTGTTELAPCVVANVTLPVTVSELFGLNVTLSAELFPAARVNGSEMPPAAKSVAFTLIWEIVKSVFPLFAIVRFCELEVPTFTMAKLRLAGLADMVTEAVNPVPLRVAVCGEFGALLETVIAPFNVPALTGANVALKDLLCPGDKIAGVVSPLTL